MTIKLIFEYGLDFEFRRVKDTLDRMDWYTKQGYKPRFPDRITIASTDDEIKNQIAKEFDEKRYTTAIDDINAGFSVFDKQFTKKIKQVFSKDVPMSYIVRLTNYGVGGSYNLPNVVILNINMKKPVKTVVHEIIHLLIQELINKYEIQQWEKERIVDNILNSKEFDFLNYNDWQSGYQGAEKYIDKLFAECFYDDREKFFSKIDSVRLISDNKFNL